MHASAKASASGTQQSAVAALRPNDFSMAYWSDAVLFAWQLDNQLRLRNISKVGAEWVGATPSQLLGSELTALLRPDIAEERIKLCREVLNTTQSVTIDGVIRGEGLRSTISHISRARSADSSILMTFCPLTWVNYLGSESGEDDKVRIAVAHDLGALEALTSRELEVLTLVAEGKSTSELAFVLNRSRRTIDCHRASISRKLAIPSIAELSLIAFRAGLIRVQEQSRRRIVLVPNTRLISQVARSRNTGSRTRRKIAPGP